MNKRHPITIVWFVFLAGCIRQPSVSPTPHIPATPSPTFPPTAVELIPLDWLRDRPFKPMPPVLPEIVLTDLPEGFQALEPGLGSGELPSGYILQMMGVEYQRLIDEQVPAEDRVKVEFYSYDRLDARTEHLELLEQQSYEWTFEQISDQRVVRYFSVGIDGRVWISGPYLIIVFSRLDTSQRGPWVDIFTEMYLEKFPPPK